MNKQTVWSLIAATALIAGVAFAAPPNAGNNTMGPGMMNGSMMAGNNMGYGMSGSMMGSHGPGPCMMGSFGMGDGMGPGMMGGSGMGHGMGQGMMGGFHALDLTADQRDKIAGIWNDTMTQAWPIMGQLRQQHFKFARLMASENPDLAAVNKAYKQMADLKAKVFDLHLRARQKMMGVLTADQRTQLQQHFHHWKQ